MVVMQWISTNGRGDVSEPLWIDRSKAVLSKALWYLLMR